MCRKNATNYHVNTNNQYYIILLHPTLERCGRMIRNAKYIYYKREDVYAIYYRSTQTIYYNIDFKAETQIIIIK